MIKIKEAIIVEGKYDKVKLSNLVDTVIVQTNGFSIFKDVEKKNYIKKLAQERGLIVLTDSDSAGFLIRNHLKSFIDEKYIRNVFIPQTLGKEARKKKASKEGFLGVEGINSEDLAKLLNSSEKVIYENVYEIKDLFNLGLCGKENSKERKGEFLKLLDLPSYISNKELIKYMNSNVEKAKEAIVQIP